MDPMSAAPHGPILLMFDTYAEIEKGKIDLQKSPKGTFLVLSPLMLWLEQILECPFLWEGLKIF